MKFVNFPQALKDGECILVAGDVKRNENYPPNFNCVPVAADQVADDYVAICKWKDQSGAERLTWRFKSEVPGLLGGGDPLAAKVKAFEETVFLSPFVPVIRMLGKLSLPETYSRYVFQLNEDFQLSAVSGNGVYKVDDLDRSVLLCASAIACAGDTLGNDELRSFGEKLYADRTSYSTVGAELPTWDRVSSLYGQFAKPWDHPFAGFGPRNPYPDNEHPVVKVAIQRAGTAPAGEALEFPFIWPTVVPVDVKANDFFMPNVNYAPIAAEIVTNDRVLVWSNETGRTICARFSSEVGGPLGNASQTGEKFSKYDVCVSDKKELTVKGVESGQAYKADAPDRAILMIASAIAAVGAKHGKRPLLEFGQRLYAARNNFVAAGAELPIADRLSSQVKSDGYFDIYQQMAEDVDYNCRKNYSLWRCIGASMQGMD